MFKPLLDCTHHVTSLLPTIGKTEYQYTPLEPNQIRLLKLHPGASDSQIQCSLKAVDLLAYEDVGAESTIKGWERFHTISYVWGTDEANIKIICDGRTTKIKPNLAGALRRFRHPERHKILWIDALCINQKDRHERASQVKLMGLIYFKAIRVRIWLGPDEELEDQCHVQDAVELIKEGAELRRSCSHDPEDKKISELSKNLFDDSKPRRLSQMTALRSLFQRPWFTRVWVVQELGLSRNATFYCGNLEFTRRDFDDFDYLMIWCETGLELQRSINTQIIHLGQLYRNSAWDGQRIERGECPKEAETFFDLLRSVRGLQCTNAKDIIYAFLGHPSAFKRQRLDVAPYFWYPRNYYEKRSTIVLPDYRESYKMPELCTDLAVTALRDYDFGLQYLSCISNDDTTINMGSPSWVRRWDLMYYPPSQFYGSQVYYAASKDLANTTFLVDSQRRVWKWPRLSLNSPKLGGYLKRPTLSFKAMKLGWICFGIRCLYDSPPEYIANLMAEVIHDIPRRGDVSFITPPSSCSWPYEDDFLLALATTLSAGLTSGPGIYSEPADEHPDHHLNTFKAYYRYEQAIEEGNRPDPDDEELAGYFRGHYNRHSYHRMLFLTFEGRFGLGPLITDSGDEVWLPMGAKMPFVLRATGNGRYKIVGQTFFYGVMRGEAVEGKCEDDFETVILK